MTPRASPRISTPNSLPCSLSSGTRRSTRPTGVRNTPSAPRSSPAKVCGGNRTRHGADTQQVLASVVRTAHQRHLDLTALLSTVLRATHPGVPDGLRPPPQPFHRTGSQEPSSINWWQRPSQYVSIPRGRPAKRRRSKYLPVTTRGPARATPQTRTRRRIPATHRDSPGNPGGVERRSQPEPSLA